jgi:hypothetical protein
MDLLGRMKYIQQKLKDLDDKLSNWVLFNIQFLLTVLPFCWIICSNDQSLLW